MKLKAILLERRKILIRYGRNNRQCKYLPQEVDFGVRNGRHFDLSDQHLLRPERSCLVSNCPSTVSGAGEP